MNNLELYYNQIDIEKNIYQLANLYDQNRKSPNEYTGLLWHPLEKREMNEHEVNEITKNNIVNFISFYNNSNSVWQKMNKQFLNYHKSLTIYTLINSAPIINYIGLHSGIGELKNIKVADIGGGTGHTLCSFFRYPETLEYFLVDPNYREMHEQFFNIYPKLSYLKMGHVLAKAEALPFKDDSIDLTMSFSSIDHMDDYKKFIEEAVRITKKSGTIFISSHFDFAPSKEDNTSTFSKIFSFTFWERLARYLYYRKYSVKNDDHTFHFNSIDPIMEELQKFSVEIVKTHVFKRYFYIVAKKL